MEKKIKIEMIVPDDAGNDVQDILHVAREIFHNAFKGNKDYKDSNVVVWDDRVTVSQKFGEDKFTETGIVVDYKKLTERDDTANRFVNAITNFFMTPEYLGMIYGKLSEDTVEDIKEANEEIESTEEETNDKGKITFEILVNKDPSLMATIDEGINQVHSGGESEHKVSIFRKAGDTDGMEINISADLTSVEDPKLVAMNLMTDMKDMMHLPGMPLHNTDLPATSTVGYRIFDLRRTVKKMLHNHNTDEECYKELRRIEHELKTILNTMEGNDG